MGMRWGTDGNSFAQMAKDYFGRKDGISII